MKKPKISQYFKKSLKIVTLAVFALSSSIIWLVVDVASQTITAVYHIYITVGVHFKITFYFKVFVAVKVATQWLACLT